LIVKLEGSLNYDKSVDLYWHGFLGWTPEYVNYIRRTGAIGINKGKPYRYVHHLEQANGIVKVFFVEIKRVSDLR